MKTTQMAGLYFARICFFSTHCGKVLRAVFALMAGAILAGVAGSSGAAVLSWSGAGATANWNESANWGFAGTPANGDTLIFSAAQPRLNNYNNIAGLTLTQIRFVGASGGYSIWGNDFTLTDGIVATNLSGVNAISNNITLSTKTASIVVSNGATMVLGGALGGAVGVIKSGLGTLAYVGATANAYGGTTTVTAGTLLLSKGGEQGFAIPHDLVVGPGCTVRGSGHFQIYSDAKRLILGEGSLFDTGSSSEWTGPITMTGAQINSGGNTLFLTGNLTVNASLSAMSLISGNLRFWGQSSTFNTVGHHFSPDLRISAAISSDGGSKLHGIVKTGNGEVDLAGANTFLGSVTVNTGNLWVSTATALGNITNAATVNSGAGLLLNGNVAIGAKPLVLNGTGWAFGALSANGSSSWAGDITLASDTTLDVRDAANALTLSGAISGVGALTKSGAGTLTLSGATANTYGGLTRVSAGTLALGKTSFDLAMAHDLTIDSGATVKHLNHNQVTNNATATINGQLNLNGFYEGLGAITGSGSLLLGSQFLDMYGSADYTFSGVISGAGYFRNFGSGKATLTGNNTYAGPTYASGTGAVMVNGYQPQSSLIVGSSSGTAGGSGTVGPIVCSGTLAPGDGPGTLTSSNVLFSSSAHFTVELTGPTGYDQLFVRGTNNLANAVLQVIPAFTSAVRPGRQFFILANDGTEAITGTFSGLTNGAVFTAGDYTFRIAYNGGTGNDVVLTLLRVPAASSATAVTAGNGNHVIDPNECNDLSITVTNESGAAMTGISAVLSTTTPGVMVSQPYSTYPNAAVNGRTTNATPFQISTLPSLVCGSDINLDLTLTTASHGAFTVPLVLHTGQPGTTPVRYDVSTITNIPDIGTMESTNVVNGFSGPITKVAVSLFLTHPMDSDLSLALIAPDGSTVNLSSGNGGGPNFGSSCSPDTNRTTFDDAAAVSITAGTPPFVGTFRPQSSLAALLGSTANGNWRLRITDSYGGSLGALRCWSLFLYPVDCAPGGGYCDPCLTVISNSITAGDLVEVGRCYRDGVSSTCASPKAFPGIFDSLNRNYDPYTFTNISGADACVTVELLQPYNTAFAVAYLNDFNPQDISQNYLGDLGHSDTLVDFSSVVPAGGRLIVVVTELNPGAGVTNYTLSVSGLCPPPMLQVQSLPGGYARLSWPTSMRGYLLESKDTLAPGTWTPHGAEPMVGDGFYSVTNPMVPPNQFYRLHKP